MRDESRSEAGQVMVTTLCLITLMAGWSLTYLTASHQFGDETSGEVAVARARLAAEEGVHLSIAELKSGDDPDGDGFGTVTFNGADDRSILVTATDLGGDLYRVRSVATVDNSSQAIEAIIEVVTADGLSSPARAAIVANGPVETTGNINVDGRDWDEWATAIIDAGVFGISTTDSITNSGSSTAGGNGMAPNHPAPAGTLEPFAVWQDGADSDGDGSIDEELFDGLDDDGDGEVDEDTHGYPVTPDAMFGLAPNSLEQYARRTGTYFTSEAALNNWISANGGDIPGGVVVFADFDDWQPVNLGNGYNDPPSIIVHHNALGDARMKNVHGAFRGMILADRIQHINGDFALIGAFMSFADEAYGNAFGNGSANVLYSSRVLSNLPTSSNANQARVLSWSRASIN